MKIATFNINGIKARIDALPQWLDEAAPDVALLQEIKSVDEAFPREIFEERGYNVETHGQKSFNGVAILSKYPLEDVIRGLPGDAEDEQARWIEATVVGQKALRICGLYLPNGNPCPGPKYEYKLAWMARMQARVAELLAEETPVFFAGDYNIIPQDEDAARPDAWRLFQHLAKDQPRGVSQNREPWPDGCVSRTGARWRQLFVLGLPSGGVEPQ
ncbi:exodeoxyribonuclease III [Paracoccaceae bacterium]|nr:exodeoxyribonuclease III [Paracoccaceae bacterium]